MFGDSQARAFADGVIKSGNELGYDVAVLATAGCPMAARAPLGVSWCEDIQDRLLDLVRGCVHIDRLPWYVSWCNDGFTTKPALIVIGNSVTRYLGDEYRLPTKDGSLPQDNASRIDSVVVATQEMIEKIKYENVPMLLIHEAPSVFIDADISLLQPKSKIEARRYSEQASRNAVVRALDRALTDVASTATFDPASIICNADLCDPVKDGENIYHDSSHLNVSG
ncbi:MAG: hypothetical protein EBV13_06795, partial [Actinobacteria bacterium]|nr:hypothetical protein [Actinomycetota bacterium]